MIVKYLGNIADYISKHGSKSSRTLAKIFNRSRSNIDREKQKSKARSHVTGASFFEMSEGATWLKNLVVAVVFIFGIHCGVGSEKLALLFSLLNISSFVAVSKSSLARLENHIDDLIIQYKDNFDAKIKDKAANLSITPGGDETFFENIMLLVCMDLNSGFIFNEEVAKSRDHKTWESSSMPWLSKFKIIRSFLSDKAKALLKLAKESLNVTQIPDLFHMMNAASKVMKFSFHRQRKSAEKQLKEIEDKITQSIDIKENKVKVDNLSNQLVLLSQQQIKYQKSMRRLSTTLHPFAVLSNKRQTTAIVNNKMLSSYDTIKTIQENLNISDPKNQLGRVEKQIPEVSLQVDMWWQWVNNSLESADIQQNIKEWLTEYLLPFAYWKNCIPKTRSKTIKRMYKISSDAAEKRLDTHPLTSRLLQKNRTQSAWVVWAQEMAKLFIRTTSAIEGRNGWLSQIHFTGRGLPKKRIKAQTAIHNYVLKRSDGTTACERLSGIKPDDLFEFIIQNIGSLAKPRKSKVQKVHNLLNLNNVPA